MADNIDEKHPGNDDPTNPPSENLFPAAGLLISQNPNPQPVQAVASVCWL